VLATPPATQAGRRINARHNNSIKDNAMAAERNKTNDYRNWSLAALDAAILYEVQNCRCTQGLDHLLAARGKRTR
jgi:hypothetical protein